MCDTVVTKALFGKSVLVQERAKRNKYVWEENPEDSCMTQKYKLKCQHIE